jgi:signal transduction histidine kinase
MGMNALRRLSKQPRLVIVAAGLSSIVLLGLLDYLTGPEVSLSVFYLLPISVVTWFTDRRSGIVVATIGAAMWLVADLKSGAAYSNPLIPYWNAGVRCAFFLIAVYLESALKTSNQRLEARVEERTARLAAEIAERQRADQRLQQYAERLEILHEIDKAILDAQSPEATAQTVAYHLRQLLPCQRVSVTLLDFQSQQIVIFASAADEEVGEPSSGRRLPLDTFDNVAEMLELLRRGAAQLVPDLRDLALSSPSTREVLSQGFRSSISAPIITQEELIGILNLLTREPGVFTPEHVEIAREVANQLGVAIQHARLWDQLRSSREELQGLSQKLLNVQEAERRHLARELHDEIGQALTGLSLTLEMIAHLPTEAAANDLSDAQELVVDLMERVGNLSLELRPALLDDLGLLPTLLWHLERYSAQTHVKVAFKHSGLEGQRFAPECETTVYRIIQEALTNVARHAGVLEARVTLWADQGVLGLQIEDRGMGFDPEAVLAAGSSSGLASMRERARLLGGELTIESVPESGTRVIAEIPIGLTGHTQEGSSE